MIRKLLLLLLGIFIIIQFFRPEKNDSNNMSHHISMKYDVSEEASVILKNACNDCHSNTTKYPWYSKVQPVAWWLDSHIQEGKDGLNFSEFLNLPIAVQNHKFEEIIEVVDENEMPLESYTYLGLHPEANLSTEEKETLTSWARAQMDLLKSTYPSDSLILKRRRPDGDH